MTNYDELRRKHTSKNFVHLRRAPAVGFKALTGRFASSLLSNPSSRRIAQKHLHWALRFFVSSKRLGGHVPLAPFRSYVATLASTLLCSGAA
nr:hypothetical protein MSCUHULR_MSCUHULR_CDS_0007 [Microvirus sp.]